MNSTSLGLEFKEEDDEDEKISKNESLSNIWKGRLHSEKVSFLFFTHDSIERNDVDARAVVSCEFGQMFCESGFDKAH